jgi:hypothetical protein
MDHHIHEKELLLASASYPLRTSDTPDISELVRQPLDWEYITLSSGRHGLASLLFRMLSEHESADLVPAEVMERLKKGYLATLMRNRLFYHVIEPLLSSFAENSVPVILLKGAALCMTIYDDIALRPLGDMDIMVHREHVTLCRELMEDAGFHLIENNYFPIPDDRNDELGCEWSYHIQNNVVELHWDLVTRLAPFQVEISRFWADAVDVEPKGGPALIMEPGNQLLHLCLHQFKHHWMHFRDLVDVALLLEKYGDSIDWDRFTRDAQEQGLGRCAYYTIKLTNQTLGTPVGYIPLAGILGRPKPNILADSMKDLIASNILESHMPRRFWELLLVDGAANKTTVIRNTLAHPFPRKLTRGQLPQDSRQGVIHRTRAAIRSVFFYRRLFIEFPRHIWRIIRKRAS